MFNGQMLGRRAVFVTLIYLFCLPSYLPVESLGATFAYFVALIGFGCYHTFIPMAIGNKLKALYWLRAGPNNCMLYFICSYTNCSLQKKKKKPPLLSVSIQSNAAYMYYIHVAVELEFHPPAFDMQKLRLETVTLGLPIWEVATAWAYVLWSMCVIILHITSLCCVRISRFYKINVFHPAPFDLWFAKALII